METLKSLAEKIANKKMTINEAASIAATLEYPIEHKDEEDSWYEGESDNVYYVVHQSLDYDTAQEFLNAIDQKMSE